jgi:rhodanese-related sulfurtransferase
MKEHQRTDRLTVITILLVILIGAILITYRAPKLNFERSPEEMLTLLQEGDNIVPVDQIGQLMKDENTSIIDLRSKGDFVVNHIKGAINVPKPQILNEESIELFDEDKNFILYGEDHTSANGVWMLLRQLGYDNVKVLLGGYNNYITDSTSYPYFIADIDDLTKAGFDLNAELDNKAKQIAEEDAAKQINVKSQAPAEKRVSRVKKSAPALPPPPAKEEEEEEGC